VSDRPRVLIVVTLAETGGAQAYVRDLIPGLIDSFDITVAAHGSGPFADAVRSRGAAFVPLRHVRRPISPIRDILGIIELWRLCRRIRPTIVHANSSKAGILGRTAAWLARVPIRIFTAHGWAFKATSALSSRVYLWADRIVAPITSVVVCVSETEYRAGVAARTCRPSRAVTIYNGVEVAPPATRPDRPKTRIVSVGRLATPKDFATLIRAASLLDPSRFDLHLLGDGPDRSDLERLTDVLGITENVTFEGDVHDVDERLLDSDVFVLSSHSEGLPISVLEAMAAGLPVVATRAGGIPELVADGVSGLLVPPDDVQALANALTTLIGDRELRVEMGAAGRRRVEKQFSIDACRAAHVSLYTRLLAEKCGHVQVDEPRHPVPVPVVVGEATTSFPVPSLPEPRRSRPRLLVVITLAETGGAQAYVRDLIPGLIDSFDITVAAHGVGPLAEAVSSRGATYVPLRHVRRAINPIRDMLGIIELWRLCRRIRPTIVHSNSSKAGILGRAAAWLARVPIRIFTAHGWAFNSRSGLTSRLYLWADRMVLPITTTVVCVSETDRLAGLAARVCTPERTITIFNGVEPRPEIERPVRDRVRIVSVGRLAYQKNFELLVRASALVDHASFDLQILGDGPDRETLQVLIDELDLHSNVTLVGEVTDVVNRLAEADIFALSSRFEGLPISVLEAMSAGLPIVSTNVDGLCELVDDGASGLLVGLDDPPRLAAALSRLVDDRDLRVAMGKAGRQRVVEHFSIDSCRSGHLALFTELVGHLA
jgi:glycosyltransferase involved in cell wall biosynthesis